MMISWLRKHAMALFFVLLGVGGMLFVFSSVLSPSVIHQSPDFPHVWPNNWFSDWVNTFLAGHSNWTPFQLIHFLGSPLWRHELFFALAALLSGCGVAFYLRTQKVAPFAAWSAGLLFSFCGYSFTLFSAGHAGYFELIAMGLFAFGLLSRCFERARWIDFLLLGAVLMWAEVHQPDIWVLFVMLLAVYGIWLSVQKWRSSRGLVWMRQVYPRFLLTILTAALIGASQLHTAMTDTLKGRKAQIESVGTSSAKMSEEAQKERNWFFATDWSLPPEDLIESFAPGVFGDSSFLPPRPYWGRLGRPASFQKGKMMPNYRQHTVYLGVLLLLFAAIGIRSWMGRRNDPTFQDVPFWVGAAVVCTILAMGRYTPLYQGFYSIPYMNFIRAPVKFHHLTEWAFAVLAGFGLHALFSFTCDRFRKRVWIIASVFAGVALIGLLVASASEGRILEEVQSLGFGAYASVLADAAKDAFSRSLLLSVIAGVGLFFWGRTASGRIRSLLLCGLVTLGVWDLSQIARRYVYPIDLTANTSENLVTRAVQEAAGGKPTAFVNYLTGGGFDQDWLGSSLSLRGHVNLSPTSATDFGAKIMAAHPQRPDLAWRQMGVRWVILPMKHASGLIQQGLLRPVKVFRMTPQKTLESANMMEKDAAALLEVPGVFSLPALLSDWTTAADCVSVLKGQSHTNVFVSDAPAGSGRVCANPLPVPLAREYGKPGAFSTKGEVKNSFSTSALLVLNQQWKEGLVATVDGKDVPLYRVNEVWAGMSIPPGVHKIALHPQRALLFPLLGAGVSLVVLGLWFFSFFFNRRSYEKDVASI